MLFFVLFFVIGLFVGIASLRLLAVWTPKHTAQPATTPIKRHHL